MDTTVDVGDLFIPRREWTDDLMSEWVRRTLMPGLAKQCGILTVRWLIVSIRRGFIPEVMAWKLRGSSYANQALIFDLERGIITFKEPRIARKISAVSYRNKNGDHVFRYSTLRRGTSRLALVVERARS